MRKHRLLATAILAFVATHAFANQAPWKPNRSCPIAKRSHEGLTPDALQALVKIGVEHRITQTINTSKTASNYHGPDGTANGKDMTSAVDISVKCLKDPAIKQLLSELANAGFAAWYRQYEKDSWKGDAHIHAVFAQEPLKRQLQRQVASWLSGKTGLVGDAKYEFWQPTDQQRASLRAMYEASKSKPIGNK